MNKLKWTEIKLMNWKIRDKIKKNGKYWDKMNKLKKIAF